MHSFVVGAFYSAIIALFAYYAAVDSGAERAEAQNTAVALNYVVYRNAIVDFAHSQTMPFNLPDSTLLTAQQRADFKLPGGWNGGLRPWGAKGEVVTEPNGRHRYYCYVYGPMTKEEVTATQKLLHNSMAVGWTENGQTFHRNEGTEGQGSAFTLPAFFKSVKSGAGKVLVVSAVLHDFH